jgi:hypothetical protein
MVDLKKYIEKRKKRSHEFAGSFEVGYESFKIGCLRWQIGEEMGIIQEGRKLSK